MTKKEKAEMIQQQKKAINEIKKYLPKNKRVYARVVYVSNSGMSRVIHFVSIKNNRLYNLDGLISKILGYKFAETRGGFGLRVGGCGMDMIFNTLYNVNCVAVNLGLIKTSKNKDNHFLRYEGVVNSNYWSF